MSPIEFGLRAVALVALLFCACVALSLVLAWLEDWFRKDSK
jgi:hypothetical protein